MISLDVSLCARLLVKLARAVWSLKREVEGKGESYPDETPAPAIFDELKEVFRDLGLEFPLTDEALLSWEDEQQDLQTLIQALKAILVQIEKGRQACQEGLHGSRSSFGDIMVRLQEDT